MDLLRSRLWYWTARLRERPLELRLLTHGAPVLADGAGALARALDL